MPPRDQHSGGDRPTSSNEYPDLLPGVMCHLSDAWSRRGEPNVLLVHYDNLSIDLDGQMRRLAGRLGIAVPEKAWPALVRAATFQSMKGSADTLVPTAGIFKNNAAFFRRVPRARDAKSSATKNWPPTGPGTIRPGTSAKG